MGRTVNTIGWLSCYFFCLISSDKSYLKMLINTKLKTVIYRPKTSYFYECVVVVSVVC